MNYYLLRKMSLHLVVIRESVFFGNTFIHAMPVSKLILITLFECCLLRLLCYTELFES